MERATWAEIRVKGISRRRFSRVLKSKNITTDSYMLGHVGARLIRQAKTSSHYFDIVLCFFLFYLLIEQKKSVFANSETINILTLRSVVREFSSAFIFVSAAVYSFNEKFAILKVSTFVKMVNYM